MNNDLDTILEIAHGPNTYFAVRSDTEIQAGVVYYRSAQGEADNALTLTTCDTTDNSSTERRCANLRRSVLATGTVALALIVLGGLSLDGVLPGWACGALCLAAGCALALTAHALSDRLADVVEGEA